MYITQGTKSCVLVSHSACIWDIKNLSCQYMHDLSLACAARGCPGKVSFATCSADGTIRLWNLVVQPESSEDCSSIAKCCSFGLKEAVGTCIGNMFLKGFNWLLPMILYSLLLSLLSICS